MRSTSSVFVATALACASAAVQGAPFTVFDARSMGMGGAGVASARTANAALFNPALLAAARGGEDFGLVLPAIGAAIYDEDEIIDAVDRIQDEEIPALEAAYDAANQPAIEGAAAQLASSLRSIDHKQAFAEFGAGIGVSIPGRRFGTALNISGYGVAGATPVVAAADLTQLDAIASGAPLPDPTDSLLSEVNAVAAAIGEIGLSFAHGMPLGNHRLAIGVTPKLQEVQAYDYTARVDDDNGFETDDITDTEVSDTSVNLDAGVALRLGEAGHWRLGLVVRNLIAHDIETAQGATIEFEPQARFGVAHHTRVTTITVDADLTENQPVAFGDKTQFIAAGAEFDLFGWAQARVGYRHNLSDGPDKDLTTLGLGFSPFGIGIDVAAFLADGSAGGVLQFGFHL
ncbi:MAG: conjugal transfer protein TraF [Pseudomonadota bacterium]|nr:conjugal transfer protein TraF [Pseudomonadota bacterium]